jgi:tetrahydromethanopterin S-methyltransferase subunit G
MLDEEKRKLEACRTELYQRGGKSILDELVSVAVALQCIESDGR